MSETTKAEKKSVKHMFSIDERLELGNRLASAHRQLACIDADFQKVKDQFKSQISAVEAAIETVSTQIRDGWEMRDKLCVVRYRPNDKKKDYYLEDQSKEAETAGIPLDQYALPVITEEMTPADFQADLILAESKFEAREEIALFNPANNDRGILVVGRMAGRWFSALRINVGGRNLEERLDSEQKSVKTRPDCVKQGCKRAQDWLAINLGKDAAKGFEASILNVVEAHKEREE